MAEIGTRAPRFSLRDITNYQWLVLFVAWAGWSLDITDFTLYGLVLRQALTELLGGTATMAQIGSVGGLLTTIGLWAGRSAASFSASSPTISAGCARWRSAS